VTDEETVMTSPPPDRDVRKRADDDTGIPRWVKVVGAIAAVVVLLIVAMMLIGGGGGAGGHSPRRHGGADGDTPPPSLTQDTPVGISDGSHSGPPEGTHE
jgi:hypothetical protein